MGDILTPEVLEAFAAELEKQAGVADALGRVTGSLRGMATKGLASMAKGRENVGELVGRVTHPVEGLQKGWRSMTPRLSMTPQEMAQIRATSAERMGGGGWGKFKERMFSEKHLLPETAKAPKPTSIGGRIRAGAEELSRRGWTGRGAATKYLPVGGKSFIAGFPMLGIPGVVNAPKPTPTGEGGTLERGMGEALGTAGWIMGSGLGPITSMGAGFGLGHAGSKLGRILDRLRAGASLGQAVRAPSPSEAAKQLETIEKYYGQPAGR